MKPYEIRKALRDARIEAQTALEDYIWGARNAPHSTLKKALIKARAYNGLLQDPNCQHSLQLLTDVENNEPYTRSI